MEKSVIAIDTTDTGSMESVHVITWLHLDECADSKPVLG